MDRVDVGVVLNCMRSSGLVDFFVCFFFFAIVPASYFSPSRFPLRGSFFMY